MIDPVQDLFDESLAAHKAGELDKAQTGYNGLLNRNPYDPMLLYLLGNAHLQQHKNGIAISLLEASLRNEPTDEIKASVYNDLGCALKAEHFDEAALAAWEAALQYGGRDPGTLNNLATLYADSGYPEKALPLIEEAMPLAPDNPHIHWNKSLALLTQGKWEQGWVEHEYRKVVSSKNVGARTYGEPWDGQTDGLLVVHGEQGLGDEIMFATCLPDLLVEHPNAVIECEKKLVGLFARSFGRPTYASEDEFRAEYPLAPGEKVYQLGMGSLPKRYRNKDADFPVRVTLRADPALVEEARVLLGKLPGPLIGVSWMGGTKVTRVQHRSLDARTVKRLAKGIGTAVSLQYGKFSDVEADEAGLLRLGDWTDGTDMEKLAAIVTVLDEVVTVCTTLVHLAGALGKPAHVLTPLRASWRYGLKSGPGAMLWYPQHTLHRQAEAGDWKPVLAGVRKYLEEKYADHQ
jgi:tetratricopeptide (TPR) repeat protein